MISNCNGFERDDWKRTPIKRKKLIDLELGTICSVLGVSKYKKIVNATIKTPNEQLYFVDISAYTNLSKKHIKKINKRRESLKLERCSYHSIRPLMLYYLSEAVNFLKLKSVTENML